MKRVSYWLGIASAIALGYITLIGPAEAQRQFSNTLAILGANAGGTPSIRAQGTDTNISINLVPKGSGTVQINGAPITVSGGTFTSLTVAPGPLNVNGQLFVTPGTSGVLHLVGTSLFHNITDTGNGADVTEDTLHTFTVPANTLSTAGQWLRWQTSVVMAANGDTKRTRVYFGATVIGDTTAVAFNNQSFTVTCDVYMVTAVTQKAYCYTGAIPTTAAAWGSGGAGTTGGFNSTTPAETLTGAVVMKITAQAGAANANDVVAKATTLRWFPQGQ